MREDFKNDQLRAVAMEAAVEDMLADIKHALDWCERVGGADARAKMKHSIAEAIK